MTTVNLGMITFDTTDATALATWWARQLDSKASDESGGGGWFVVVPIEGGPTLGFQKVADPTPGKNRLHLDLTVPDRSAAAARMTADGATLVADQKMGDVGSEFSWTVLADPDGNQFCLAQADGH